MKSLFKYDEKHHLTSWIISNFPLNYETMDYVQLRSGSADVFFNKKTSTRTEILNDSDLGIIQIFRALREDPKKFIKKILKADKLEDFIQAKQTNTFEDYVHHAVNEFILRKNSIKGLKDKFHLHKQDEKHLEKLSFRIKKANIFHNKDLQIIKAFNEENTLLYCDAPDIKDEFDLSNYKDLTLMLSSFKGRVIISGTPFYKKSFPNWCCVNKKDLKLKKIDVLIMNYDEKGNLNRLKINKV